MCILCVCVCGMIAIDTPRRKRKEREKKKRMWRDEESKKILGGRLGGKAGEKT